MRLVADSATYQTRTGVVTRFNIQHSTFNISPLRNWDSRSHERTPRGDA
jgi:hypothetical protein